MTKWKPGDEFAYVRGSDVSIYIITEIDETRRLLHHANGYTSIDYAVPVTPELRRASSVYRARLTVQRAAESGTLPDSVALLFAQILDADDPEQAAGDVREALITQIDALAELGDPRDEAQAERLRALAGEE